MYPKVCTARPPRQERPQGGAGTSHSHRERAHAEIPVAVRGRAGDGDVGDREQEAAGAVAGDWRRGVVRVVRRRGRGPRDDGPGRRLRDDVQVRAAVQNGRGVPGGCSGVASEGVCGVGGGGTGMH